ncbi:hypothetical protein BVRB_1g017390 isoform A [Beta vulgaris subsp. vulgaris]|nr:hypothetical protein BVRB_1g017390 isoform A [Beta vulgaris subsp. vulgaris]
MSQNQTRVEKKEKYYRKTGGVKPNNTLSDYQYKNISATGRGDSSALSLSSNRSFKKSNNAQGGQSRGELGSVNTTSDTNSLAAGVYPVKNGNHVQPKLRDGPAASSTNKTTNSSIHKSSQPVPKALSSQSSSMNLDSTSPSTPPKGEAGKGFPLQFGSISPGFVDGKQVPARTSSAPPDLDEQKHDQMRHAAAREAPAIPVTSGPKQQVPEKHVSSEQPAGQETHIVSKATRDVQMMPVPPLFQSMQSQKPVGLPMTRMPMPLPYQQHQSFVPIQFGGPNPQIQTKGTLNNSIHMPMQIPLNVGNGQQQVLLPGLQHHLMQNQGIIHQGQSFGFNPRLGTQLPHLPRNIGMTLSPQFNLLQPGNVGNTRKTVKITHPETHEELRLDKRDGGSPGSRLHHMASPPSQPVPSFTAMGPRGYYSSSYTSASPLFPVPNFLPLTSIRVTASSQAPRFNYPISQATPTKLSVNQAASNSFSNGKHTTSVHEVLESSEDVTGTVHDVLPSVHSISPTVTVEAAVDSAAERGTDSNAIEKAESQKVVRSPVDPGVVRKNIKANADESSPQSESDSECLEKSIIYAPTNTDAIKKEIVMDVQKHLWKKEHVQPSPQVGVQTDASAFLDHGNSCKVAAPQYAEPDISNFSLVHGKGDFPWKESPVRKDAGSTDAVAVDIGAEKHSDKIRHATQNSHVLQATKQQGEKEVARLQPDSALKASESVKRTEQCDELKKFNHEAAGFEAYQGESEPSPFINEGDQAALQSSPPENLSKSMSDNEAAPANLSEANLKQEVEVREKTRPTSWGTVSGSNKNPVDSNKIKNNRGKKKWKEMLPKADGLGTTADQDMANKSPQEKKETVDGEGASRISTGKENSSRKEHSKLKLEDWEDAADVSGSKLASSVQGQHGGSHHDKGALVKKYSRDFLLTFSEQCTDLPKGVQIMPDISDTSLHFNANVSHDYASSRRYIDRASGASRNDRRVNGTMDLGRWNKPGLNYGFPRNTRGQGPIQHSGGILSGPMHSMVFQGIQQTNSGADRWQRATSFNKGLMAAPETPSQVMHRAENKYEVGKVSDEEQAKQRTLKAILNKLTPQNFEKLFEQVKEVNIDNAVTLTGVISQIFDKALTEPTFCEMYANFCSHLASELPDLSVDNEKITFKRLLLNKCQEEFERGEREEEEANMDLGEGEIKQTEEEREGKRLRARRRMLGNIRLIGELYKKRMLTERIMHECIKKLLGQYQNADEENIEALCKLMSTIGDMIDHPKAKEHMDAYFDIMGQLSTNMRLSSRVRFMLKDATDLRKNNWQQRRKVEGPKKIEEVHRDAAQERLGQVGRLGRGSSMNSAMRRGQPVEYDPRGSMLPSSAGHGFRGVSAQVRGYGGQDARMDDRSIFENKILSVPLPQRSSGDDPITLGPQGGLARGMSCRGEPSASISPSADTSYHVNSRRMVSGSNNGSSTASDHVAYSSGEDHFRHASERIEAPVASDQSCGLELDSIYTNKDAGNSDKSMDKSTLTSSLVSRAITTPVDSIALEEMWPEERLRDKSMAAIKEYYSANDEKEVALCLKDLNAPKLYPTVISSWVTDAFERKDLERDMLAKLLISLTKPQDSIFSPQQLIEGIESVLKNLEDTVTDAPKAPEFLGQVLGKVVLENVLSFKELGELIHKGGEEPGRLLHIGLAADVLGNILEMIKLEKGESTLNEIRTSSNLRFEDFRPPYPLKSKKLEMFIMTDI